MDQSSHMWRAIIDLHFDIAPIYLILFPVIFQCSLIVPFVSLIVRWASTIDKAFFFCSLEHIAWAHCCNISSSDALNNNSEIGTPRSLMRSQGLPLAIARRDRSATRAVAWATFLISLFPHGNGTCDDIPSGRWNSLSFHIVYEKNFISPPGLFSLQPGRNTSQKQLKWRGARGNNHFYIQPLLRGPKIDSSAMDPPSLKRAHNSLQLHDV